jgi:hypothetical protein
MTPSSDIVAAINTATFEITLTHDISIGGSITVEFPKWNPSAATGSIFSMIQGTFT